MNKAEATIKQIKMLHYIRGVQRAFRVSPSLGEIAIGMGFRSKYAAWKTVRALIERRLIETDYKGRIRFPREWVPAK